MTSTSPIVYDDDVDFIGHSVNTSFMTTLLSNYFSASGVITTVAGNGNGGFVSDNGPATLATLNEPYDVTVDAIGDIYIADYRNNRIRKVTRSTGVISTVAGTGTRGYSGDNGLATIATLKFPVRVAVDAEGNIYIADSSNNCIRMVTKSTGVITTVAGTGTRGYSGDNGLATIADITYPGGIAVDASGNVYIADSYNNRIRMVTKSTGVITTVAGNGAESYSGDNGLATSAALRVPKGIAVDAEGNIYIADSSNNRIRMVSKSTGVITTVAGTGSKFNSKKVLEYGFNGKATSANLVNPEGIAVGASGNIYFSEPTYSHILLVNKSTGVITKVAGNGGETYSGDNGLATLAALKRPQGIAVDASGRVYIADTYNHRIRMIDATELSTLSPSIAPTSTRVPSAAPTSTPSIAPTSTPSPLPIPATSSVVTSPTTSSTSISSTVLPGVVGGIGGFILILLALAVICCCRRR